MKLPPTILNIITSIYILQKRPNIFYCKTIMKQDNYVKIQKLLLTLSMI